VLATTGFLTGLAAFIAIGWDGSTMRGRLRWAAIPAAILGATLAAIFAQPLGLFLQENYTVDGNPGNLTIKGVTLESERNLIIHRVETSQ
jgi:ABC-type phosphate/phosphonate transport system permease subunit